MEITGGSCRLGLWYVHVWWSNNRIYRVRFASTGIPGPVPAMIQEYCGGHPVDLSGLDTVACEGDLVSSRIYSAVRKIPYGSTATYGEIAQQVGTSPRAVGRAMAHNPTPLVVPCHRVVAASGIGGFTPALEIKEQLLALEKKAKSRKGK
ncbi:MGMT family protein [Methanoregula sp.]|uniref:methylated-DNA--[protein]-cysteine S-methyltransferase n=1 Tax=Methanoregula sp. TaxID=2052170 RepID=UPI002B6C150B|nr:MGMT family protein [Methanoregula sp.]HVP97323.1 MGMT family protein [Methanoregula sp.]